MAETYDHIERQRNDFGCEIVRLRKQNKQLKAENKELRVKIAGAEQCDKCKYTNPKGPATCPDNADGNLPCSCFTEKGGE